MECFGQIHLIITLIFLLDKKIKVHKLYLGNSERIIDILSFYDDAATLSSYEQYDTE